MEKFASVKNCEKCNANVFTPIDKVFMGKRKYVPASIGENENVIPEHLEVTCHDCGFTWQEQCSDSDSGVE